MREDRHYIEFQNSKVVESKGIKCRMRRYVNLAKALFRNGATSNGRTFNVCFAVKKSKIIAIGLNDYNRKMDNYNRRLKGYYKKYGDKSYHPCLHAEMSALLKLGTDDCSDISFYNVRLNRGCHCCNSQPCLNCYHMLNLVNAKHIYYYDDDMNICEC